MGIARSAPGRFSGRVPGRVSGRNAGRPAWKGLPEWDVPAYPSSGPQAVEVGEVGRHGIFFVCFDLDIKGNYPFVKNCL